MQCCNCPATESPIWRKSRLFHPGQDICNACRSKEHRALKKIKNEQDHPAGWQQLPKDEPFFICTNKSCRHLGPLADYGTRRIGNKDYRQPQCRKCRAAAAVLNNQRQKQLKQLASID